MRVLVTGGAGFIGSHVVDMLVEHNHDVSLVDLKAGNNVRENKKIKYYQVDICSDELEEVFKSEKPEIVFHLAAQSVVPPSIKDPLYDQSVNIGGTINILECMKKYASRKIIYSSSAAIYGNPASLPIKEEHPKNPVSPYGLSKYVAEEYIQLYNRMYGIDYSILRYANIYGSRQTAEGEGGVISIFIDKLKNGEPLTIFGDGRHTRDYVYVKDVAKANMLAMEYGKEAVVNISTGQQTSVIELVKNFEKVTSEKIEVKHLDERVGDVVYSSLDSEESEKLLAWKATTSLKSGLEMTIEEP